MMLSSLGRRSCCGGSLHRRHRAPTSSWGGRILLPRIVYIPPTTTRGTAAAAAVPFGDRPSPPPPPLVGRRRRSLLAIASPCDVFVVLRALSSSSSSSSLAGPSSSNNEPPKRWSSSAATGADSSSGGGFGEFLDRQRTRGGGALPTTPVATTASSGPNDVVGESHEEDWLDANHDGGGGYAHAGGYDDSGGEMRDELREWHATKEEELRTLSYRVDRTLESSIECESDVGAVLSLMEELVAHSSSVASEMHRHSDSDFRRRNGMYPPSAFMADVTRISAEGAESLLAHLLLGSGGSLLTPETEVSAYGLAMAAWSHAYHPQAGDRCESILERYGERFGGDMNHTPPIGAYKTVLAAHLMSCSSTSAFDRKGSSPGEKALDLLTLLSSVHTAGDMFLKPDAEMYRLTVSVIRNTLLDWRSRRRFQQPSNDDPRGALEGNLAAGLLDALERMETSLGGEMKKRRDVNSEGPRLSLRQWYGVIGAYADGLAVASSIPMKNGGKVSDKLLKKLEQFISENSADIFLSIHDDRMIDIDVRELLEEVQWCVEAAYGSALSSGLRLSKEAGNSFDFNGAVENAMSSEETFQRMRNRAQESPTDEQFLFPLPTPENYRALVNCWCECVRKRYCNPESNHRMANLAELPHLKAASLLRQLEVQLAGQSVDGSIYMDVIWAWGQVLNWPSIYKEQNDYFFAANAVDMILKRAMSQYANEIVYFHWNGTVTKMYNMAFRLHSKIFQGGDKVVKRSLKLLDEMEHWYKQSDGAIAQPDDFTFALILKSISNSGLQSSASSAEAVVQKMNNFGLKPRERHYLGLIRAHARVGQMDVSDPRKAEAILQQVKKIYDQNKSVKPTTSMYSACISAYGGSKEYNSTSKVMELFEELKALYGRTNDAAFQPDSMLYSAVIDAISRATTKSSASLHQAIELLDKMEHSHDTGEADTGPNRYAYTNLLRAITTTRMENGTKLAEELIQRMDSRSRLLNDESIRPDTQAYTSLIQTFANDKQRFAVERAQEWFQHMEKRYKDGDARCRPNKVTCTALINCWRRSERPEAGEEAEKIISMMEKRYEEGDLEMKPDAFVYASAIDAWARSNSPEKAMQAWIIYQRMKSQYSKGNLESKPNNVIVSRYHEEFVRRFERDEPF